MLETTALLPSRAAAGGLVQDEPFVVVLVEFSSSRLQPRTVAHNLEVPVAVVVGVPLIVVTPNVVVISHIWAVCSLQSDGRGSYVIFPSGSFLDTYVR